MNKCVMIVDDDPYICLAVSELLSKHALTIVEANGALSCLENVKNGFKGLILMDIMMPKYDGWDAINMLIDEGLFNDLVIVMLTAKDEPDRKMEGLQKHVTDYVTKPFESDELVSVVMGSLELLDHV